MCKFLLLARCGDPELPSDVAWMQVFGNMSPDFRRAHYDCLSYSHALSIDSPTPV